MILSKDTPGSHNNQLMGIPWGGDTNVEFANKCE